MKPKLYIITLEPIEKRYTKQWYHYFKKEFSKWFNVEYIDGIIGGDEIKKGRFLDINKTNIWKAQQVESIAGMFDRGIIKDDDIFFFADGWHFGITALKYMSQLNNIETKIYAYWHAGCYDPYDFITQAGLRSWAKYIEKGWFNALDGSFVATYYHRSLIKEFHRDIDVNDNIYVVGFPMDWKEEIHKLNINYDKRKKIVVFPHRLDKEKCPDVFDALAESMPGIKFIKTMEVTKDKKEYYDLLAKSMIVFSGSKQETFGIGCVEAMSLGCIPITPNDLSYKELYDDIFRYKNYPEAAAKIRIFIKEYENYKEQAKKNIEVIHKQSLQSIEKMAKVMLE